MGPQNCVVVGREDIGLNHFPLFLTIKDVGKTEDRSLQVHVVNYDETLYFKMVKVWIEEVETKIAKVGSNKWYVSDRRRHTRKPTIVLEYSYIRLF